MLVLEGLGFPGGSEGKASAYNVGDLGSIPELGRSPGEGSGNPLQYSYLENPIDRGTWQAIVHGVARAGHNLATKPPNHHQPYNWMSVGNINLLEGYSPCHVAVSDKNGSSHSSVSFSL